MAGHGDCDGERSETGLTATDAELELRERAARQRQRRRAARGWSAPPPVAGRRGASDDDSPPAEALIENLAGETEDEPAALARAWRRRWLTVVALAATAVIAVGVSLIEDGKPPRAPVSSLSTTSPVVRPASTVPPADATASVVAVTTGDGGLTAPQRRLVEDLHRRHLRVRSSCRAVPGGPGRVAASIRCSLPRARLSVLRLRSVDDLSRSRRSGAFSRLLRGSEFLGHSVSGCFAPPRDRARSRLAGYTSRWMTRHGDSGSFALMERRGHPHIVWSYRRLRMIVDATATASAARPLCRIFNSATTYG